MIPCLLAVASGSMDAQASLQSTVDKIHAGGKIPGMTAAIALPDGRIISAAAGTFDGKRPMRPNDRMLAGSVGKMFVGAYAAQLIEAGKLNLDDPIGKHLSPMEGFAEIPNGKAVTYRQAFNHQTGIPEHVQSESFIDALKREPDRKWKPEELLGFVRGEKALFAPGADWAYADTNYVLAGAAMERLTGKPLFAEIEAKVVRPLRLPSTQAQRSRKIRGLAVGNQREGSPFGPAGPVVVDGKLPFDPEMEYAGGGIVSTSSDLAKFARQVYKEPYGKWMREAVPSKLGPGQRYGIGAQFRPSPSGESFGHSGWYPGYVTEVEYFPDLDIAVAVQITSDDVRAYGMGTRRMIQEILAVAKGSN